MPNGSILVIDDEAEIREGLELLLSSEGYAVASAETGESGLAHLEQEPYDLLLLDVNLPGRSGLDLLRDIRQRDPDLGQTTNCSRKSPRRSRGGVCGKKMFSSSGRSSSVTTSRT